MPDQMPTIPPEVPEQMRRRLERTWREAPERFEAELRITLNILAREPKPYRPRAWPADAPPPDQDELERRIG